MASGTMTIRLNDKLKTRLEKLADADAGQMFEHETIVKRWKKKRADSVDKRR